MSSFDADLAAIVGDHLEGVGLTVTRGSVVLNRARTHRVLVDDSRHCCVVEACGDCVSVERVGPLSKPRHDLLLHDVSTVAYGSTTANVFDYAVFRPPVLVELSNPGFLDAVSGTVLREFRAAGRRRLRSRLLVAGSLSSSALALLALLPGVRWRGPVVAVAILMSWTCTYLKSTAKA